MYPDCGDRVDIQYVIMRRIWDTDPRRNQKGVKPKVESVHIPKQEELLVKYMIFMSMRNED